MFDVTIEQQALMKALEYLEPTVGKNAANLGDNCVSMESTAAGSIVMFTTNTIEFTKVEVLATSTSQDIAPYVDFKRLKMIVSTIPVGDSITLTQSVNDLLISFSLRSKPIRLVGCINGMLPFPSNSSVYDVATFPKEFIKNAVEKSSTIITESAAAPIYNCIKFTTSGQSLIAEAIDVSNKRSYTCTANGPIMNNKTEILLEALKMKKSLKLFEDYNDIEMGMDSAIVLLTGSDPVQYQKTKGNITQVVYCTRRLSSMFPSISQYLTNKPIDSIRLIKEDLLNSIIRVKALGDDSSFKSGIVINAGANSCNVNFNSTYGDLVDPVEVTIPMTGTFTATFRHDSLDGILKAIGDTSTIDIGVMPNSNGGNYMIKSSTSSTGGITNDEIFTLMTMVSAGTSAP